jgi:hypothetical protein
MIVNEDGGVTGSIDVSKLDELEPKTDEARAQVEQLKADARAGQEQSARDAERLAEQARAQNPGQAEDVPDTRDAQGKELEGRPQGGALQQPDAERQQRDAERQQAEADTGQGEDVEALRAEAEAAGVTVDKRWGADRLRQETAAAQAKSSQKQR